MFGPQRMRIIDRQRSFRLFCFALFTVLLLFFLTDFFRIYEIDFFRHKAAVFIKDFFYSVLVAVLIAILVQIQRDLSTDILFIGIAHLKLCTAIAFPMNGFCAFLIRQRINRNLICNHKRRIETKTKVSDDLVVICFVFIFLKEVCSTAECDVIDILFDFICSHTDTVIDKAQSLFRRVCYDLDLKMISFRKLILAHHLEFSKFGDRVASI